MNTGEYSEPNPANPERPEVLRRETIERALIWRNLLHSVNSDHTKLLREYKLPTSEQYVIRAAANEVVPEPHDRYALAPRYRLPVVEGVAEVRVRVPVVEIFDHNDEGDTELPTTDVCFELVSDDKTKRPARFLLNAAGFWPYFDAKDLTPNTDIEKPGMFEIPGSLNDPRDYEILELINELLVIYRPLQVGNRSAEVV